MSNLFEEPPDYPGDPTGRNTPPFQRGDETRQTVDLSRQLERSFGTISSLLDQLKGSFGDINHILVQNVDHIDKIKRGSGDITKQVREEAGHRQKTRQELDHQQRITERLGRAQEEMARGRFNAIRKEAREFDLYDRKRGQYLIPGGKGREGRYVDPQEFSRVLSMPDSPEKTAILEQLQANARRTTQSPQFRITELLHSLITGDVRGALREVTQPSRISGTITGGLESFGLGLAARGGRLAGAGALLTRGAGVIGGLATPAVALGAVEALRRIMGQVNEARDIAGITGQSGFATGAGVRARATLAGLNPFDLLSGREALEAQVAVRQAGYQGARATAVADIVTDLRQDLSLPISESAQLVVTAMRDVGLTSNETRAQLGGLDDAARLAGTSVKDLATTVQATMEELSLRGRAAAAGVIPGTEAFQAEFRGLRVGREGGRFLQGFFQPQVRELLGLQVGVPPWETYSRQFTAQIPQLINRFLLQLARSKPDDMGWNDYANFLFVANPLVAQIFAETGPQNLADMMQRVWHTTRGGARPGEAMRAPMQAELRGAADLAERQLGGMTVHRQIMQGRGAGIISDMQTPQSIARASRQALSTLRTAAISAGIGREQIAAIFSPVREAIASGDSGQIRDAFREAENRLRTTAATEKLQVSIDFAPDMKRLVRGSGQWLDYAAGQRGSQGVIRNP